MAKRLHLLTNKEILIFRNDTWFFAAPLMGTSVSITIAHRAHDQHCELPYDPAVPNVGLQGFKGGLWGAVVDGMG